MLSEAEEARGEAARRTRLVDALGDEVVDEDADEAICTAENELLLALRGAAGVDAGEDALRRRLLVAGRAVDLAGEEQARDAPCLESICMIGEGESARLAEAGCRKAREREREGRTLELARVDVVILDAVARLDHVDVLESRDRAQQLELVLGGKRDRDAVRVDEVCGRVLALVSRSLGLLGSARRRSQDAPES